MTMIDADKAIELLEECYIEPANDVRAIFHNMGVGAALSEIRHLREEAEENKAKRNRDVEQEGDNEE